MIAALPMYDWPEVRVETDRLWSVLRESFRAEGLDAPEGLTRDRGLDDIWRDPELLLAQTCGLPLALGLPVVVLGAGDYGVPDCPPGFYRSAVVARADDPRGDLADFRGARVAVNSLDSQSGYAALLHHVAPLAWEGRFFGGRFLTGAHEASARAVAEGSADLAALDYVSWRLFRRFRPEATRLRVVMLTDPTPGLPFVAAAGTEPERHRRVLAAALADGVGPAGPRRFVPMDAEDYAIIRDRFEVAAARVRI